MPGSVSTRLPAPPTSLAPPPTSRAPTSLAPPPPPTPPAPPPPPPAAAAASARAPPPPPPPPPMARTPSQISAGDLLSVKLKTSGSAPRPPKKESAPPGLWGEDLLKKALASRRQAQVDDDETVDFGN